MKPKNKFLNSILNSTFPGLSSVRSGVKTAVNMSKPIPSVSSATSPVDINKAVSSGGLTINQVGSNPIPKPNQTLTQNPAAKAYMETFNTGDAPLNPYNPPNGIVPETKTPEQKNSSTKQAYIDAYKSYIDSLNESADIKEAKTAYNDYIANIAKSKAGLEGQGRGIPLEIVRGQQEKLLGQTQPEALRLQGEVDIAQGSNLAKQNAAKAMVDFNKGLLDLEKGEGFTLGKDQVRYDAQGNIIAGGVTGTQEGSADVDAWVKGIQSGVYKPSDVPDELKSAVANKLSVTEKPQSEISKQVLSVIDELLLNPKIKGITGPIDQLIGGGLLGGADAALAKNKFNQLKGLLSLENIKYLKGTGAISDAEQRLLANAASALGRNLYDQTFISELQNLKAGLSAIGDSNITPDEEEYLRLKGYSQEEINSLKGNVGNTRASIPQSSRLSYVNNNPGNLRYAGQKGAIRGEGGFAKFATPEDGIKALENQIKLDASRGLTLAQFVSKYAPPTENNTNLYIKQVAQMVGTSPSTLIKGIDLNSLVRAIAQKESGTKIYG